MTKLIKKPGLYTDLDANDYHADPCPEPSLSSSIIDVILDESAARAWAEHPKHPDFERDEDAKFNLPNVCHALLLNAGRNYVMVDAPDWRTNAAKELRDKTIKDGKIPILEHQFEQARSIVTVGSREINQSGIGRFWFSDAAKSEVAGVWKEGDLWCRMLIDRLWLPEPGANGAPLIMDYKTTEAAINEWTVSEYAVNQGWHIQSNWYKRGLAKILNPKAAESWKPPEFWFIVQTRKRPYPIMVVKLSRALDTIAERQIDWAMDKWRNERTDLYSEAMADLPSWYQSKWLTRELADDPDAPLEISNNG